MSGASLVSVRSRARNVGLIYDRATPLGKRVQANLGAKNHAVIMPDGTLKPLFI